MAFLLDPSEPLTLSPEAPVDPRPYRVERPQDETPGAYLWIVFLGVQALALAVLLVRGRHALLDGVAGLLG